MIVMQINKSNVIILFDERNTIQHNTAISDNVFCYLWKYESKINIFKRFLAVSENIKNCETQQIESNSDTAPPPPIAATLI